MLIAPRASVRTNLIIWILLTVISSWIISGGIANYLNYLSFRSLRQEMMKHHNVYTGPIPEPRFGLVEFLTGRPPIPRGPRRPILGPPPGPGPRPEHHPAGMPGGAPPGLSPDSFELQALFLRLGVALCLAALAGALLGRKFTKPLTQLAKGAGAFQSGDFNYRIPVRGANEFAAVAVAMNEMAGQVSDQINRLESDAERRRRFLADIAHELRSPVTTMETMAGALKDGIAKEPERRNFAISALAVTSQRLRRLVQDLMELAKLDLTELPLNLVQVDLCELIPLIIRSHEVEAESASIRLHPLTSTGPVNAVVDPDRMIQVLNNIFENAISYAGEGAEVRASLKDGNPIEISISDNGKGINDADMPYVLDPFYRADSARTPNDSHSGLGLSIASKLIEAHGGKLTISSKESRGTTVIIQIPKKH